MATEFYLPGERVTKVYKGTGREMFQIGRRYSTAKLNNTTVRDGIVDAVVVDWKCSDALDRCGFGRVPDATLVVTLQHVKKYSLPDQPDYVETIETVAKHINGESTGV